MHSGFARWTAAAAIAAAASLLGSSLSGELHARQFAATADTLTELRAWDRLVEHAIRSGELRLRSESADTLAGGHRHQRFDQYHKGVRVFGADVTRHLDPSGVTLSVLGHLYSRIEVGTVPILSGSEAKRVIERLGGRVLGPARVPELLILPHGGSYRLAYWEQVMTARDLTAYFVDAHTAEPIWEYSNLRKQPAIGRGRGVLADEKKVSALLAVDRHLADDRFRPPSLATFDMRGSLNRTIDYLNGVIAPAAAHMASTGMDNVWTDGANVDTHVYTGWTYDYLYKRFNRRGLDGDDLRILSIAHPVRRADFVGFLEDEDFDVLELFYVGAFYCPACGHDRRGMASYGVGLPEGWVLIQPDGTAQTVDFLSGGLDIVAHELAHGVTAFSSNLLPRDEAGALNEAFSDVIGIGATFFFRPAGTGTMQANYMLGSDVFRPGGIRRADNPRLGGTPDHYSRYDPRLGIHYNSTIVSHAFYLAIEGGTNRTSGIAVQGVGAANREQIEKVFYQAFVELLPATATFSTARTATIHAARTLYGAGSAAERAVTEAWNAVGVR